MRVLVTGGARSGKSAHAESLLRDEPAVVYVAPGPVPDESADPEWAARVAAHRERRPDTWRTHETGDIATAVREAEGAVIVDCLGTWVTRLLDEELAWDADADAVRVLFDERLEALGRALRECTATVVVVTNEVGLGIVPERRSGRLFRDLLGTANQRVAQDCVEVHLVVAGRVLRL